MRRALILLCVLAAGWATMGASCKPKPPQPPGLPCGGSCPPNLTCRDGKCIDACAGVTCPPGVPCRDGLCHAIPPPPEPETITTGLVRRDGPVLTDKDGKPAPLRFYVPCCMPPPGGEPDDAPPGWPMIKAEEVDRALSLSTGPLKPNAYELRPGPFTSKSEPEYPELGGYVGDKASGGVNPVFMAELDKQVIDIGHRGGVAMVVLLDCWYCRHYELAHPWDGTDARASCGVKLEPISAGWITTIVETVGRHHNLVFLVGNECDINAGYDAEIEGQVYELVRAVEAKHGYPVHMIGAQSRWDKAQAGPVDFVVLHQTHPPEGPKYGKPTLALEYNPNPPLTVAGINAYRCLAEETGTYYGLWRHGMEFGEWAKAVDAFSYPCGSQPAPSSCPDPKPDPAKLVWSVKCSDGGVCDPTPLVAKDCEFCRDIGMGTGPGGQVRCGCPARNECPGTPGYESLCTDRIACEQHLMQAPFPVWKGDGEIRPVDENLFRVKCDGCNWLEVCNGPGTICAMAYGEKP